MATTTAAPATAPTRRNRITGSGQEAPDQLLANPANWRILPKAQQDGLAGALDQVGWVQQVLVNRRSGFVVDGHARVALALSRGEATVPVLYVDLAPTRRRSFSRPSTRSARWPGATPPSLAAPGRERPPDRQRSRRQG